MAASELNVQPHDAQACAGWGARSVKGITMNTGADIPRGMDLFIASPEQKRKWDGCAVQTGDTQPAAQAHER
jgi:hypothetical protein